MNSQRQALFWLAVALALFGILALLRDILLPFVMGAAIAYFLDPLADRLQRIGLARLWATIIIVVAFVLAIVIGLVFLLPPLLEQLAGLAAKLPSYVQSLRDMLMSYADLWLGDALDRGDGRIEQAAAQFIEKATGWTAQFMGSVWSGGMAVVNTLALFLVTPVVTFYLLLDWDRMVADIDGWLPRDHAETIRSLAREIDDVLSGFVRGQLTVLVLLGVMYVIGLTAIGLNFGLLIGVGAALVSFIPYVGPLFGLVIGGTVAIVQFGADWVPIVGVLGVFLVAQLVEGNVLSPLIVGDRVKLHPVWLIFALFVFAFLFGFVGMLLAVPAAAAIGVLVRFAMHKYQESPLYYGQQGARKATRSGSRKK